MTNQKVSASGLLLTLILLLTPLLFAVEYAAPNVWNNRLFIPHIILEPHRHTPRFAIGHFLPPRLKTDLTLSPADGPILLTTETTVPAGVHLTITAGSTIYAHEFAELRIEGEVTIQGTADSPVTFTTNELHPLNKTWNGLIFLPGSHGQITHAHLQYAAPGISCVSDQPVTLDHLFIEFTPLGLFTTSAHCSLANSRIRSTLDGISAIGVTPPITTTTIHARRKEIKVY